MDKETKHSTDETFYSADYIEGILGIKLDKDENGRYVLTESLKQRIEQEKLLYEGMLDSIRSVAGQALEKGVSAVTNYKDFTVGLGKVIMDANLLRLFLKKTMEIIIEPVKKVISQYVERLTRFPKLSTIVQFVKRKLQQIHQELSGILASGGARAVFVMTSVATILSFAKKKLEDIMGVIEDKAQETTVDAAKDTVVEKTVQQAFSFISNAFGDANLSIVKVAMSKMTDIKTYLGWLGPIVGGINFVVQTFGPVFKQVLSSVPVAENLRPPLFLLEEMTKGEIKDLVKDEIKSNLKKMVEEELEKLLKDNKKIKNEIGDLSKEILKMLYKDLSIHHSYVIDRVKF